MRRLLPLLLACAIGCAHASSTTSDAPSIDLGPAPDSHPASAEVTRAEALLAESHPAEAASLLEARVSAAPGDARAHFTLGLARTLLGDATGAESAFRRALAIDARYPEALNELGLLLRDTDRLADGIVSLRAAVDARPDFHDAWYNLALASEDAGDLPGARAAYDHAIEGLGSDPIVRFHRAGLLLRLGDAEAGHRELLRARELASGRSDVLRAIARTLLRAGFAEDASDTIERAITPAVDADLLLEAAGAARSAHRLDLAVERARRASALAPSSARAAAMLALVESDAGHRAEARAALDRADALDVDHALREDLARLRERLDAMH